MMLNVPRMLSVVLLILQSSIIYKTANSFATNQESISSVFESHGGYSLLGHVIDSCAGSELECGLRCLRNDRCRSYNCFVNGSLKTQVCHLSGETRNSKPENYTKNKQWTYCELIQVVNSKLFCQNSRRWSSNQSQCTCNSGYKGNNCQTKKLGHFSSKPGNSCKNIRDSGDSIGDGEYWIDLEKNGNPLKVYCEMTTDAGGWLLVTNFLMDNSTPPSDWTAEQTYRGISNYTNNRMGITKGAMTQLRTHLGFSQLRFHCSKKQGRTFHVTTAANSSGEAVVQYFSGQTNVLPAACGSFQRMDDDDSQLAVTCDQWGNDGNHYVGKWGHHNKKGEYRMYDHAAFVAHLHHWVIVDGNWLCDDRGSTPSAISSGDFWKIYAR